MDKNRLMVVRVVVLFAFWMLGVYLSARLVHTQNEMLVAVSLFFFIMFYVYRRIVTKKDKKDK
jgi:hypothetical protein